MKRDAKNPKKRLPIVPMLALLLAIGLAGLAAVMLPGDSEVIESEVNRLPVVVTQPQRQTLRRTLSLSGRVASDNQVTILPRVAGEILSMLVETGDEVVAGQVIARIDSDTYRIQMEQAQADYDAASASFDRVRRSYEAGASSLEQYNNANAMFAGARGQYELATLQYGYTEVSSPVSGTVLARLANNGSMAGPQVPLYVIGSLNTLSITVAVPERYYGAIAGKSPSVHIRGDLPGQETPATIRTVSPSIQPATRTFDVVLNVPADSGLVPGMLCMIDLDLAVMEDVWSVPLETMGNRQALWYVDDASLARRLEYPDAFIGDSRIALPDEWSNYVFILEGQHFLDEGQAVNIIGTR